MSNGRRFRRNGRVYIGFSDRASDSDDDCPVCRALGQHIEEDGSIVQVEGAEVDEAEALRLIIEHGEVW